GGHQHPADWRLGCLVNVDFGWARPGCSRMRSSRLEQLHRTRIPASTRRLPEGNPGRNLVGTCAETGVGGNETHRARRQVALLRVAQELLRRHVESAARPG